MVHMTMIHPRKEVTTIPMVVISVIFTLLLPIAHAGRNKNYYMPSKDCNSVSVREIDGAVIRSSPSELYGNSACFLKFEADDSLFTSKRLMINFEHLDLKDCDVSLKIYYASSSTGRHPDHALTCSSQKPPIIITSGKYATIRLDTRTDKDYSFRIILTSFKETGFCSGDFRCANRRCIDDKLRCDGINHCGDNSDELRCTDIRMHDRRRFGVGSTVASAFSTLIIVGICVALCVLCVRRRRASQGQILQQQQLMVHTGVEPGPPPPGLNQQTAPPPGPYQPVPTGYQVPNYNPGAYPPPGPGQPPPPYGYPQQGYYPPPMPPAGGYPPPSDPVYPPPGPPPMGVPGAQPPPGQYPVTYMADTNQVKLPGQ